MLKFQNLNMQLNNHKMDKVNKKSLQKLKNQNNKLKLEMIMVNQNNINLLLINKEKKLKI